MTLIVRLLGPVQISHDDQPISIRGYKALALLAYLLLTGQAHSRQHLIDLLFDGPADPKASLRWILSDGTMGCHTSQIVSGTYKKAHRHMCGTNVFTIDGDAQNPPSSLPGELQVVQLESLRGEVGLYYIPDVGNLCHSVPRQYTQKPGGAQRRPPDRKASCCRRGL